MQKVFRIGLAAVAAGALLHVPSVSQAQATASITASATVAGALTATNLRDLSFGTVIPGFTRTVTPSDATSGHFQIDGGVNSEVQVQFTALPQNLTDGTNTLPITYTSTYNTADAGGSGTTFTPVDGVTTRLDAATGQLHIYIGGSIVVPAGQVAGLYQETITLSASYTGN
ncbi:MAG: hypothetical protein AMS20_09960 [Gemmatimonas sp. SG8_28]|nr:MAG: hypothetical protein AMS20_09960 [Gemmatimonas sp. SG8_28]